MWGTNRPNTSQRHINSAVAAAALQAAAAAVNSSNNNSTTSSSSNNARDRSNHDTASDHTPRSNTTTAADLLHQAAAAREAQRRHRLERLQIATSIMDIEEQERLVQQQQQQQAAARSFHTQLTAAQQYSAGPHDNGVVRGGGGGGGRSRNGNGNGGSGGMLGPVSHSAAVAAAMEMRARQAAQQGYGAADLTELEYRQQMQQQQHRGSVGSRTSSSGNLNVGLNGSMEMDEDGMYGEDYTSRRLQQQQQMGMDMDMDMDMNGGKNRNGAGSSSFLQPSPLMKRKNNANSSKFAITDYDDDVDENHDSDQEEEDHDDDDDDGSIPEKEQPRDNTKNTDMEEDDSDNDDREDVQKVMEKRTKQTTTTNTVAQDNEKEDDLDARQDTEKKSSSSSSSSSIQKPPQKSLQRPPIRGKVLRKSIPNKSDDEDNEGEDSDKDNDDQDQEMDTTTSATTTPSNGTISSTPSTKSQESKSSSSVKETPTTSVSTSSSSTTTSAKTPASSTSSSKSKKEPTSTKSKKGKATPSTAKKGKKSTSTTTTPNNNNKSKAGEKTPGSTTPTPKRSTSKRKTPTSTPTPSTFNTSPLSNNGIQPSLHTPVPKLTPTQYTNLDALMTQFCKVPLLAEFSRPISLLHPELTPLYSKVVHHPMDLGKVCRGIRKRGYENARAVCIDMWRIFANCVKYHTHPLTREGAIVSFISIGMHLRSFFNALWYEYMLPSEIPNTSRKTHDLNKLAMSNAAKKRDAARKERLHALNQTGLSFKCIESAVRSIDLFVERSGRVDDLDEQPIERTQKNLEEARGAIMPVFSELKQLILKLKSLLDDPQVEYTVDQLDKDIKRCYNHEVFEGMPALRNIFEKRLDRLMGKIFVPVLEANERGGNQSSIWGCMAAVIWARESTKKPYWPALVLGIMAPDDQTEEWHRVVTKRNEMRLPEKLRNELQAGKRKAEQAIRRQNNGTAERMSFFLVEFLGTHEFIWIREADIIERFDSNEDPNQQTSAGNITKKKKATLRGQTPANERMRQKAIDEGQWAMQEFEMQLNDPCGDLSDEEDMEEEENYTFSVLCESDSEADEADGGLVEVEEKLPDGETLGSPNSKITDDVDEIHELISTDGLLDYSVEGRKNAKKRAAALKKQQADLKREQAKKEKEKEKVKEKEQKAKAAKAMKRAKEVAESKKKILAKSKKEKDIEKEKRNSDLEQKREQKELEKRRKKRERDRERFLKEEERKAKKMKSGESSSVVKRGRKLGIADKRGRAASIIRGYLNRTAKKDNLKGLGLSGVLGIPAASVEASGLLGLTLAFRAAAGEIEMPNASDNPSVFQPWDRIIIDDCAPAQERCADYQQQIKLLEGALKKLDQDDLRRKELIEQVKKEKEQNDLAIEKAETLARQNDMPKRKPFVKKKDNSPKPSDVKGGNAQEIEDDNKEQEEDEVTLVVEDTKEDNQADEEDTKDLDSLECEEDIGSPQIASQ